MHFLTMILIFALCGCTTLTGQHVKTPSSEKNVLTVSGAIAAKNKAQGWTATFHWTQNAPDDYQILIYGPLGSDTMDITAHDGQVTYHEGKTIIHTHNAEDLLAKETGIRLPVNHLYYWIKGKPAPGAVTEIIRSSDHDILILKQGGYTIEYSKYHEHHPYKIRLSKQALTVKLVIKEWGRNTLIHKI